MLSVCLYLSALALMDGSAVHAVAGVLVFSVAAQRAFARASGFAERDAVPFAVFAPRWHSSVPFADALFPAVVAASDVPDSVWRLACLAAVDTFCLPQHFLCLSPCTDGIELRSRGCSYWYELRLHLVDDLCLLHVPELYRERQLLWQLRRCHGSPPALMLQRWEACRDWQRRAVQGWNEPAAHAGFGQQLDPRGVPGRSFPLLPTHEH